MRKKQCLMIDFSAKIRQQQLFSVEPNPSTINQCEIQIDAREIILKIESVYMELQKATSNLIKHLSKISEKDGLLQEAFHFKE